MERMRKEDERYDMDMIKHVYYLLGEDWIVIRGEVVYLYLVLCESASSSTQALTVNEVEEPVSLSPSNGGVNCHRSSAMIHDPSNHLRRFHRFHHPCRRRKNAGTGWTNGLMEMDRRREMTMKL